MNNVIPDIYTYICAANPQQSKINIKNHISQSNDCSKLNVDDSLGFIVYNILLALKMNNLEASVVTLNRTIH